MYSRIVHTKFPRTKHADVFAIDETGMPTDTSSFSGAYGFTVNRGSELLPSVNCTSERMYKYPAMGSHIVGTTYHAVREKIFAAITLDRPAAAMQKQDLPLSSQVQKDVETRGRDAAGVLAAGNTTW